MFSRDNPKRRPRALAVGATLAAVGLLSAVVPASGIMSTAANAKVPAPPVLSGHGTTQAVAEAKIISPDLGAALAGAHLIGALPGSSRLQLSLGLKSRDASGLARLLSSGRTVSERVYAREFGPAPSLVRSAAQWLSREGLHALWTPGDPVLEVRGPAGAAQRAFSVRLGLYRTQVGGGPAVSFYAPMRAPRLPLSLSRVINSVSGLDDYPELASGGLGANALAAPATRVAANSGTPAAANCGNIQDPSAVGGFTPSQVAGFYNFNPLYKAGLDGSGQTVVFIETDGYSQSDLSGFASGFNLPPFQITGPVVSSSWGLNAPVPAQGCGGSEAELDLEIVHAMAPQAHLVVYDAAFQGRPFAQVIVALASAVDSYPKAVFSISMGWCEDQSAAQQFESLFSKLEAVGGGSVFVSSGDNGAYARACPNHVLSVEEPGDAPHATSVGGTTALIGQGSTYGEEASWGGPYEQWGAGGGLSLYFQRPSWQAGLGVSNQYSNGKRQVPDVSAIADSGTGWDTYEGGSWGITGGTSAAAPLWAALAALTNQALAQRHLGQMGFANVPLYDMGANPRHFPAPAFHPVTRGTNLFYPATSPGWNFGTGWGTPNAAAVVDDFIAYQKGTR